MRWHPSLLVTALSLGLLSGCADRAPDPLSWAGTAALVAQQSKGFAPYQSGAVIRVDGLLTQPQHLVGQPLTDLQVRSIAQQFLTLTAQEVWLTPEERKTLLSPGVLPQWREALAGQSTRVAEEVGALVTQRQEAWRTKHGPSTHAPALPDTGLTSGAWNTQMLAWKPSEQGSILVPLTTDSLVLNLIEARTLALDPHTRLVRPQPAQAYNEKALRTAHGVGVVLALHDKRLLIESLFPGAPAALSKKVKPGDELVAIRKADAPWETVTTTDRAMELLRLENDWVELRLKRNGKTSVVRLAAATYPNNTESMVVNKEVLTSPTGQKIRALRLEARFFYEDGEEGKSIADEMQAALAEANDVDVVVLDLRRCSGGGLEEALKVAGLFVEGGELGSLRMGDDRKHPLLDPSKGQYWAGPIQVWVGPETASSAELVAQAIRDRVKGAQVLGWPTYGKGTLQKRLELDMASVRLSKPSRLGEIWYTVAEIYSPSGRSMQQQGVALDGLLPNQVPQPWGEKSLPGALRPTPAAPETHPRPIKSAPALQPATPDKAGLPQWRKAAGELLSNPRPGE